MRLVPSPPASMPPVHNSIGVMACIRPPISWTGLAIALSICFDTNVSASGLSGNLLRQIDPLGRTNSWTYEAVFNFPVTFTNAARWCRALGLR